MQCLGSGPYFQIKISTYITGEIEAIITYSELIQNTANTSRFNMAFSCTSCQSKLESKHSLYRHMFKHWPWQANPIMFANIVEVDFIYVVSLNLTLSPTNIGGSINTAKTQRYLSTILSSMRNIERSFLQQRGTVKGALPATKYNFSIDSG